MLYLIIEALFSLGLFINAMLFVPQIVKIINRRSSHDVALSMFVGFLLIQTTMVIHGLIHSDYILTSGGILSMMTTSGVIITSLIYRYKKHAAETQ